jgi:group I intron endonuclease
VAYIKTTLRRTSGVYVIRNVVTGEFYVGSTSDLGRRLAQHRYDIRHGTSGCPPLRAAACECGESALVFEPICIAPLAESRALEHGMLARLVGHPRCYNTNRTAYGGRPGRPHSPETRARMRERRALRTPPSDAAREATRRKRSESMKRACQRRTPEQEARRIAATRAACLGRTNAPEEIRKRKDTIARRRAERGQVV